MPSFMDFPVVKLTEELERCRVAWRELPANEHRSWFLRWMEVYKDFHAPERRRLRGARAMAEAQSLCRGSFVLIPCRNPSSKAWSAVGKAYACEGSVLPDLTEVSHLVDVFISPFDLSWTLLYGHEVDVFGGPEFSCAVWFCQPSAERALRRESNR